MALPAAIATALSRETLKKGGLVIAGWLSTEFGKDGIGAVKGAGMGLKHRRLAKKAAIHFRGWYAAVPFPDGKTRWVTWDARKEARRAFPVYAGDLGEALEGIDPAATATSWDA